MREAASDTYGPPLEQAVEEALVEELYRRSRASFLGLGCVLGLLYFLLLDAFRRAPHVHTIFWMVCAFVAVRIVFVQHAKRAKGWFASTRHRHVAFTIGSTLTAIGFCVLNLSAFPHLDGMQVAILTVCQTGINAIALVNMGSSPVAYHLYMIPNLVPMSAVTAFGPHAAELRLLPAMIMLYVTVLSMMALHEYRSRRDNIVLRLQVAEMALVDSLTNLRNRRYLQEFMTGEVDRIQRDWSGRDAPKLRLWVMMLDLDHFKRVNDEHGHDAGDAVLQQLAAVLLDTVRRHDVVARWGGEEFVVVARDADEAAGSILAERIRSSVAGHRFELPGGATLSVTCSIGYAIYPFWDAQPQALRWDDVLGVADTALYRAKQSGRNRAVGIVGADATDPTSVESIRADVDRASEAGIIRVEQVRAVA